MIAGLTARPYERPLRCFNDNHLPSSQIFLFPQLLFFLSAASACGKDKRVQVTPVVAPPGAVAGYPFAFDERAGNGSSVVRANALNAFAVPDLDVAAILNAACGSDTVPRSTSQSR
jgi:hypothetical protein